MAVALSVQELPVFFIKEHGKYIAYTPALDLSTCGDTLSHAKKRFSEAVKLFFQEIIKMGTLEEVLLSCGWEKVSKLKGGWRPPVVVSQDKVPVKVPVTV